MIDKSLFVTLGLLAATPSLAQPIKADASTVVIHNADTPLLTIFAWERNGKFINARQGDGTEIPYDAAKNQVKIMAFPSGAIRELHFEKGSRTHPHLNREDIINYSVSVRRVQIANEQSAQINPGDASLHPAGVNHHAEMLTGGIQIEIAFPGAIAPGVETTWLTRAERPLLPVAEWTQDGRPIRAVGVLAQSAPADAVRYTARRFEFGDYALEEWRLDKGVHTQTSVPNADLLMYVVEGSVAVTVDGASSQASTGDAIRAPAGKSYSLEARQNAVVVIAPAPRTRRRS